MLNAYLERVVIGFGCLLLIAGFIWFGFVRQPYVTPGEKRQVQELLNADFGETIHVVANEVYHGRDGVMLMHEQVKVRRQTVDRYFVSRRPAGDADGMRGTAVVAAIDQATFDYLRGLTAEPPAGMSAPPASPTSLTPSSVQMDVPVVVPSSVTP